MKAIKSPDLTIRRAKMDDLAAIVDLGVALARQHFNYDQQRFIREPFEPLEQTHTDFFREQLNNPNSVFLVAEENGRIIGYAFLRLERKSLGDLLDNGVWLHDIYFEENARGRGVGKLFFDSVIDEAKKLGSKSLMLTVSPDNKTAREFFTKRGFRQTMIEMRVDF